MTALPLWLAFALSRRAASRRYTYGYGRAEDLAGVFIVLVIAVSAALAAYESYLHLIDPRDLENTGWVIAAAIIGFIGNEVVAELRIRTGREIGSAALTADGQHARVDGLTSLAVLVGALGVMAGFERADPIVGAVISLAILLILKDVAFSIGQRLLDAVDPRIVDALEHEAAEATAGRPGVEGVSNLRVRWLGHRLEAEMSLTVDPDMATRESHGRVEELRHALFHALPELASIIVHVEPGGTESPVAHELTAHHDHPPG
jgi:cation diffusion facilitator family transporter